MIKWFKPNYVIYRKILRFKYNFKIKNDIHSKVTLYKESIGKI